MDALRSGVEAAKKQIIQQNSHFELNYNASASFLFSGFRHEHIIIISYRFIWVTFIYQVNWPYSHFFVHIIIMQYNFPPTDIFWTKLISLRGLTFVNWTCQICVTHISVISLTLLRNLKRCGGVNLSDTHVVQCAGFDCVRPGKSSSHIAPEFVDLTNSPQAKRIACLASNSIRNLRISLCMFLPKCKWNYMNHLIVSRNCIAISTCFRGAWCCYALLMCVVRGAFSLTEVQKVSAT